jgi:hypothetical protein
MATRSTSDLSSKVSRNIGVFPTRLGLRKPSSSLSPGLYSDAVLSPIKQETYSPTISSPGTINTAISTDYRPKTLIDGRPSYPPVQQFQPTRDRLTRTGHWQDSSRHIPPLLGRSSSQDSPPILPPRLTHQESTLSTEGYISGKVTPNELGMRTLPNPATLGSTGPSRPAHPLDLGSSAHGVSLPPIAGLSVISDGQRGADGMKALLRASEIARQENFKGGSAGLQRIVNGSGQEDEEGSS